MCWAVCLGQEGALGVNDRNALQELTAQEYIVYIISAFREGEFRDMSASVKADFQFYHGAPEQGYLRLLVNGGEAG